MASGAPVVTAGADLVVDHACGGTPFACRPTLAGNPLALALSATASDPAGGALATRWRMVPPPGADPGASVTFARGVTSLVNEAWVETPGGAIAGTWRFRLRATSATGLVGQAEQLVQIGNRPPVLAAQPFLVDHRHESGAWLAGGTLPLPATDPDGDPLTLTATLVEVGADGCTSRLGALTAGSVAFSTSCVEATRLIGLATRTIHVIVTDGNGATVEVDIPVEIGNRPPVLRLTSNAAGDQVSVDHTVGACPGGAGSCFLAGGTAAFVAEDPDGDPVTSPAVAATLLPGLQASTGEATTAAGVATFLFTTSLSTPAEFRSADGRSPFSLVATAADPFGASSTLGIPVIVKNRPPVLKAGIASVTVAHRYDPARAAYVATASLAAFEDPDGDPLVPAGSVGHGPCSRFSFVAGAGQVECVLSYTPAAGLPPLASLVGDHLVRLNAFDGWEHAGLGAATVVNVQNGAPSVTAKPGPVESCLCTCTRTSADSPECLEWRWQIDRSFVQLPITVADADGDPVRVTYLPAPASGAQRTSLPAACGAAYSVTGGPVSVQVTVDDGVSQALVTTTLDAACSVSSRICVP